MPGEKDDEAGKAEEEQKALAMAVGDLFGKDAPEMLERARQSFQAFQEVLRKIVVEGVGGPVVHPHAPTRPPALPALPKREDPAIEALWAAIPETKVPGYWKTLEQNASTWAHELSGQTFWKAAKEAHRAWSIDYFKEKGAALSSSSDFPVFVGKEMPRLKAKTLDEIRRKQGEPRRVFRDGVPVPRINDIVRVRIATRYLDGIAFLSDRLTSVLRDHGLDVEGRDEARGTGYYARHLYFEYPRIFNFVGKPCDATIRCEVQIATELSTIIWDRTHGAYELARESEKGDASWQWDGNHPRFLAAQLAHMIHLADGLVVRLRDRLREVKRK